MSYGSWGRTVSRVRKPLSSSGLAFASEWNGQRNLPVTSSTVGLGDKRKFWWTGSCGHTWEASIPSRVGGSGCAVCDGKQVTPGINDIATTHPEIASSWDYSKNPLELNPTLISKGSGRKIFWVCKKYHSYQCTVANRVSGTGCPYCSGRRVAPENSLSSVYPELMKQWSSKNILNPTEVSAGSGKQVWWVCEDGHEWKTTVYSVAVQRTGCPTCWGRVRVTGVNDASTLLPHLGKEFDSEKNPRPLSSYGPGSGMKLWWRCELGHSYQATLANRSNGTGCPFCSNRKLLSGFNDLATCRPDLAEQLDEKKSGFKAQDLIIGSATKVWWLCEKRHSWQVSVSSRSKTNCPICSGNQLLPGYNDLKTTNPKLAKEWHPEKNKSKVESVSGGSHKKAWWLGKCGHEWQATISSRNHQGIGCPVCNGKMVLPGFNDLAEIDPSLAKEWDFEKNHPITPNQVSVSSGKKFWWKCSEGHSWKTDVSHRRQGRQCPTCANSGFDPNSPGYLYFLRQDSWEMYQIGITNNPKRRLSDHAKNGFAVIDVRGPMDGHLAANWETSLLKFLRNVGADLGNQRIAGKFDGFSESWTFKSYKARTLVELMRNCEEYESR